MFNVFGDPKQMKCNPPHLPLFSCSRFTRNSTHQLKIQFDQVTFPFLRNMLLGGKIFDTKSIREDNLINKAKK